MEITEIYFKSNKVEIHWASGRGWGVINLEIRPNDILELRTETLGKEFAKEVLNALIDGSKLVE